MCFIIIGFALFQSIPINHKNIFFKKQRSVEKQNIIFNTPDKIFLGNSAHKY